MATESPSVDSVDAPVQQPGEPRAPARTKRVLMISCAFPPTGGPGVQRSAKFAKYLPGCGWRPTIWCARRLDGLPHDESLLADLPPDLDVRHRVERNRQATVPTPIRRAECELTLQCKGVSPTVLSRTAAVECSPGWSAVTDRLTAQPGENATPQPKPPQGATERLCTVGLRREQGHRPSSAVRWRLDRLSARMMRSMVPDPMVFWALRSYRHLGRIIEDEGIDVIYSTFSPASNHLLGWLLKRRTRRPWVADFRDLWTDDCTYQAGRWRRRMDRWLEQRFLESADVVIAVSDRQRDILADRLPNNHLADCRAKVVTITNGVDTEDFDRVDRDKARDELHGPPERFVLVFTGWFLANRVNQGVIDGLGAFARWARSRGTDFEFRVVGRISEKMKSRLAAGGVKCVTTGYLPHAEAIRHTVSADVLLLPAPAGRNAETLMPAKVFEYLAAGRPILVTGPPDGEAQRAVARCQAGLRADADTDAVCTALIHLWRQWQSNRIPTGCPLETLATFTRKKLTKQLARVLDQVAADSGTEPRP